MLYDKTGRLIKANESLLYFGNRLVSSKRIVSSLENGMLSYRYPGSRKIYRHFFRVGTVSTALRIVLLDDRDVIR